MIGQIQGRPQQLESAVFIGGDRDRALARVKIVIFEKYIWIFAPHINKWIREKTPLGCCLLYTSRGQTDTLRKMSDRIEHDIYYIQHWTFRMDLIIIARTAVSGWTGRNVY